jgi:hypothetical protein
MKRFVDASDPSGNARGSTVSGAWLAPTRASGDDA